ncbi:uncharacterized protein CCOS01_04138 [Colletotrichum costaricense]|uniref:Uncharacterized protein n=1 Tax=Colletotrichum costaricense TaxID=1209916 RepID=A0AAI9Z1U4_9PEZI|nr:uncharacterized protein CCOS01_04138 [Colletotrichum costaricense]KAK1532155.1 hypothetical protein CCOS01_04138 [Colletotrichum costaricense]
MSATSSALGAVLGYLGAEVAGISLFERLLWPERFYNAVDAIALIRLALFMPMGGPLHRAALETLDKFRDHGLYKGRRRGDMLGTTFFSDKASVHYLHKTATTPEGRKLPRAVRNGFWIEVLKHVDDRISLGGSWTGAGPAPVPDTVRLKEGGEAPADTVRTTRRIYRLDLEFQSSQGSEASPQLKAFNENFGFRTLLGIVVSELSSILLAVAAGIWSNQSRDGQDAPAKWFIGFLCIPLFLKLFAAVARVRRESVIHDEGSPESSTLNVTAPSSPAAEASITEKDPTPASPDHHQETEIFEVEVPSIGFLLISTPSPASQASFQFFRHYGHPIRDSALDRAREVASIVTVYAFVLYFPAGLLLLSWMNESMQYLWLGQQLWSVLVMHLVRLFGWEGTSRTEEAVAAALVKDFRVVLAGEKACVEATLRMEEVTSVREGRKRVQEMLEGL